MSGPPPESGSTAEEDDYFAAVERHFVGLRGSPAFITPKEWHLIFDWHRRSIPLRVVRQALDQSFARLSLRRAGQLSRRRPYRLSYCRQQVESAYRRFREVLAGSSEEAFQSTAELREDLRVFLGGLEQDLSEAGERLRGPVPALGRLLDRSAERLRTAEGELGEASRLLGLEAELQALEADLLDAAETELPEAERARIREEAEHQFISYRERMPPQVYRSAVESAYLKRIRARFGLPRIGLSAW